MRYLSTILFTLSLTATQAQIQFSFNNNAAAANVTSPSDVDSLFYWFAADVSVLDSAGATIGGGEGVGTWTDLSGNGYDVVQSDTTADPRWCSTCGPNGYPSLEFDGTNDWLFEENPHWWESDDITIILVVKFSTASDLSLNRQEFLLAKENDGSTNRQWFLDENFGSTNYRFRAYKDGGSANRSQYEDGAKTANWDLVTMTADGVGGAAFYINSVAQSTSVSNNGTGDGSIYDYSNRLSIGASDYASPSSYFKGSISEIIVFSRALTTSEREAIENYLNTKYQLY